MAENSSCACNDKVVIGRKVQVVFGGLMTGIEVTAKVDTGAYTGGLHAEEIKVDNDELYFKPFSKTNPVVRIKDYRQKWVKTSKGDKETRYVIRMPAKVNDVETELELTLAKRSEMKNELLIGRKNLYDKFIVDVSL
ncbi:MAG: RimK/LysX family protein [Patescibacteria group bacterium]